jgi:hypothetical protein
MTMTEEIKRRIELKQQLIKITEQEIKDLEDDLIRQGAAKGDK